MAPQPNRRRRRELKQDRFRDTTITFFDRLGDQLEGKGRTILYVLAGLVLLGALIGVLRYRGERQSDAARLALGRAITISEAQVSASPQPPTPGSNTPTFTSERERSERAIKEFQEVAAKYPDPYRETAQYFIATNLLVTDRPRGIGELEKLTKAGDDKIAAMAKFALAQTREADGQYDAAAALYRELTGDKQATITADTLNLRLAAVYEKQGKRQEAADILFRIVETARKGRDKDGKALTTSAAARDAAQKLETLDPARYAQLPPEPTTNPLAL